MEPGLESSIELYKSEGEEKGGHLVGPHLLKLMTLSSLVLLSALLLGGTSAAPSTSSKPVLLPDSALLHKHGRWDAAPGTWWAGSGFKLVATGLDSLTLHLGNHSTTPQLAAALSVDYGDFTTVNISAGANVISIPPTAVKGKNRVVRINVEGWQNNRLHLEKIELNAGAVVKPYKPSPLRFQFIGDSLSAGQYNPRGVNDAWTFLTAQEFKAEHSINAQPGACLVTEDTGYYYTTDHNYTTPWDFRNDLAPTHIVIAIGSSKRQRI
ncbi:hypothetical protein FRC10_007466 [Ceratobasidium sp. 414]|nr:hypothetical protein FRC10_007466 [Ceratobasidium sp. 414]